MPGVTDPTEALFKDGTWGWDGTEWRKLALVWGYSEALAEAKSHTKSGAATYNMDFATVPAGEIHVLTSLSGQVSTVNPTQIHICAIIGGVTVRLRVREYTTAWESVDIQGMIVLEEDDYIRITFSSAADGDFLRGGIVGYKMKVTE